MMEEECRLNALAVEQVKLQARLNIGVHMANYTHLALGKIDNRIRALEITVASVEQDLRDAKDALAIAIAEADAMRSVYNDCEAENQSAQRAAPGMCGDSYKPI